MISRCHPLGRRAPRLGSYRLISCMKVDKVSWIVSTFSPSTAGLLWALSVLLKTCRLYNIAKVLERIERLSWYSEGAPSVSLRARPAFIRRLLTCIQSPIDQLKHAIVDFLGDEYRRNEWWEQPGWIFQHIFIPWRLLQGLLKSDPFLIQRYPLHQADGSLSRRPRYS